MSAVNVQNILRKAVLSGFITEIQPEKANSGKSLVVERGGRPVPKTRHVWVMFDNDGGDTRTSEFPNQVGLWSLATSEPFLPNSISSLRLLIVKFLVSRGLLTGSEKALSLCIIHLPALRRGRELILQDVRTLDPFNLTMAEDLTPKSAHAHTQAQFH